MPITALGVVGPPGPQGIPGPQGDPGIQGDPGPQGPPTVSVGSMTAPGTGRARVAYNGTTFALKNPDKVFLNDYPGVDPTGVTECAAAIQAALNDAVANGIRTVWCDNGSIYSIGTQIDIPGTTTLEGPMRRGQQGQSTTNKVEFKAATTGMTMFRLAGNYAEIRGVRLNLNNPTCTGVVGVRPNRHWQRIDHVLFSNADATSTGVRGGGILYFHSEGCMFSDAFLGRGYDLLNAYADIPANSYYGVNVGEIVWCTFGANAGAIRYDGIMDVKDCDFEGSWGTNPVIVFGSASYSASGEIIRNYFELTSTVSKCIQIVNGSPRILHNRAYGHAQADVGSYFVDATWLDSPTIKGNAIINFETGIIVGGQRASNLDGPDIGPNNYSVVTNPLSVSPGGPLSLSTTKVGTITRAGDGRIITQGAIINAPVAAGVSANTTIDLRQSNYFRFDPSANITLTWSNSAVGTQTVTIGNASTSGKTITLPKANWDTAEGVDAVMNPGEHRTFLVLPSIWSGANPVEIAPRAKVKPAVTKTASFTADTSARIYFVDATAGNVVITLPSAGTWTGEPFIFKRKDATANTVTFAGTVEGVASYAPIASQNAVAGIGVIAGGWWKVA